ncbi:6-phospho-3-hexuloisomerase [Macrococcus hajekii]|uniref:6-phospho-3-hexuloisomerase n=1 Tax=Macrococcus hajekii TaxID=198482 RepID=A0A4R6BJT9_9STAP|nr:6-phospho-3-hexuloisomerase [Macrococcus hajekii]TDM01982.1 6-phospho-3-hexuloisomerase [Macrococcus hajekii]GGB09045.1 3-hexulose-6-phosphate isomerase [Macrococcus hajekii]
MKTTDYLNTIIQELKAAASAVSDSEAEQLAKQIIQSDKVFVAGAGRSGLMSRSLSMRLMQMGRESYVVGETSTPPLQSGDLLIVGSGSGETKTLLAIAEKAKSLGGKVAVITTAPDSTIGRLADITVQLTGATKDQTANNTQTIQPMGSLVEQTMLLFYDAVVLRLMELTELDTEKMYAHHANLE